jgi:RNA polymerase sigma-70 factor (ECF subfamily)
MRKDRVAIDQQVDGVAANRVDRARAGDAAALHELLADLRPRIFRYCLSRLADPQLADDVTQEVTATIVTTLHRYRDQGKPFAAFAFGIASKKVGEARRRARRRLEDATGYLPDRPDGGAGPEESVLRLEATERMRLLLEKLPRRQAEVMRLRIAAGLDVAETAGLLGITPNAVRVNQHRALGRLRQLLVDGG